ncbi:MAG: hypothetical protein WBP03_03735 [Candidatus Saccharimonadales bacterium]
MADQENVQPTGEKSVTDLYALAMMYIVEAVALTPPDIAAQRLAMESDGSFLASTALYDVGVELEKWLMIPNGRGMYDVYKVNADEEGETSFILLQPDEEGIDTLMRIDRAIRDLRSHPPEA